MTTGTTSDGELPRVQHGNEFINPGDVNRLLAQARDQSRTLAAQLVVECRKLALYAASIAKLGNLPGGIDTCADTVAKELTGEALKIEQHLERTAPKNSTGAGSSPVAAAA